MYHNTSKEEYIEIVEWLDNTPDTLVHRFEGKFNRVIKNGAQLIVRPSQIAVTLNDGKTDKIFEPGHYELEPPSKCEIFFISTKVFSAMKWNASANVPFYYGGAYHPTNIRANGTYSLQVADATQILQKLSCIAGDYKTGHIAFELSKIISANLAATLGACGKNPLDYTSSINEISQAMEQRIGAESFYGIKIVKFQITNFNLPYDLGKQIDSGIGAIVGSNVRY
ncbi:MAG: SPFH domain-containing protein [Bacteroidales bacterium]|nr:SPFH domain-containing protein [Bacteroidales bacterium]